MKAINVQVSDELKERIDAAAHREHRTQKAIVVIAVERYLAEAEKDTKGEAA